MTAAAQEFVRPLTFAALTGRSASRPVFASSRTLSSASSTSRVAQENELLVVAPATADLLAKFAHGLADDFLTTLYLAFTGPVVLAPGDEHEHVAAPGHAGEYGDAAPSAATASSSRTTGYLACGMIGPGRLAEPETIADAVEARVAPRRDLEGETVLITAGPTQEPLDPVAIISNRSSGKMGYALAEAAAARGARVILVSRPGASGAAAGVEVIRVRTAQSRCATRCLAHLEAATIVIKAAAVADFHLSKVPEQKVKKTAARSLELDPTPDILAELGRKKGDRLLIGFAAETQNLQQEARRKLESKNCDMVVGNLVAASETGLRIRPERSGAGACAPARRSRCRAPPSAKSPTGSSTRF